MNQGLKICLCFSFFLYVGAAYGHSCPALMHQIDAAMESTEIASSDKLMVNALRYFGEHQHKNGAHSDSVETLNVALMILKNKSGYEAKSGSNNTTDTYNADK